MSVIQNGVPVIIPFEDGKRSLLPAVMVTKNGDLIIGEPEPLTDSRRYLRFCKRDLCSSKCVTIGGEDYTPKRIASILIRRLKEQAETFLGEQVTCAVITVPAYFTHKQRSEIIQAAADAGLDTRRLLNASTAVALNDRSENDRIFLVIDLGASGLEVSVAESGDGFYEVLAIAYNDRIGGAAYDQRISEWVTRQIRLQTGINLSHDRAAQRVLLQLAEQAKIKLSAADSAEINVPASVRRGSSDLRYVLSRALFNRLTADLTASVKDCVMSAVSDSGVRMRDIDGVVFSGGASRIPAVWKELEAIQVVSARQPERILGNGFVPEQRAAVGAAVMAGMISGDIRSSPVVLDITTHSLGVETMGGVMTKLIERNTTIPIFKKQVFSTASDNQTQVELNVLQGENERAVDNIQLGIFTLTGIQFAKRGIPQIEVTFSIDANGVISVGAKDLRTGQEQKITIR
ncbi:MAG: Hsp70 family protein [Ruminococcus sp.]|nr:Hsp70 family protein [Ruminococcus sp.]